MSADLAVNERISTELQEKVLLGGDLSRLSNAERLAFYSNVCESLGLNPLTRPFEYITLNGKLTLYARKDCTEQLRTKRGVSIARLDREVVEGIYVVTAHAVDKEGRTDTSIGAVPIANLQGEVKANAMMKAETKAKRRVTLSICGLGMLDESEVDSIPDAKPHVTVMDQKRTAQAKIAELKQEGAQRSTDGETGTAIKLDMPATDKDFSVTYAIEQHEDDLVIAKPLVSTTAPAAFIWRIGKHKGESIATVPDDYLDWFVQNGKMEDHRDAALNELDRRRGQGAMA